MVEMAPRGGRVRVADYIASELSARGVTDVFLVTGGGAMHLNDAFNRAPGMRVTCFHHEQAAAMAADSYFRMLNRPAVVNVTCGPGGINAINGVAGAHFDSMGMIVVSGQVKRATLVRNANLPLRQLGDQEVDIVSMVKGITKYAVSLDDPASARYHLERAAHLAVSGRPGPVWLDVPIDVQGAHVDPPAMLAYDPAQDRTTTLGSSDVHVAARAIADELCASRRPVIYAGAGIRIGGALDAFRDLATAWGVPVVTSLNAHDLIGSDSPLLAGRPGMIGDRAGNFAVQNADFVLVLGTRLSIRQVGYDWTGFAPRARVAMVDIDAAELSKPTLSLHLPVHADVKGAIDALVALGRPGRPGQWASWLEWCRQRRERYPVVLPEHRETVGSVNPYAAAEAVSLALPTDGLLVCGNGWAGTAAAQAAVMCDTQRLYSNSGCGSMGHELPAAIGAAIAHPDRAVVCLAGEGSLQMNIQELQTLVHHRLGVTIVVLNNGGYHSIRQTQEKFFPDAPIGYDPATGVSFPDVARIADAYGLPFRRVSSLTELSDAVRDGTTSAGPSICEVIVDQDQPYAPKAASRALPDGRIESAPLEDMWPFLSREELADNTIDPVPSLAPSSACPVP